jgi:hypothetical protein
VNLEELVRAALAEEAKAEPSEAGAYERFLHRRGRGALAVAVSTGLAVALVLALAIGVAVALRGGGTDEAAGPVNPAPTTAPAPASTTLPQPTGPPETTRPAPPPVPVSADGVVRRERQGFELTLPKGWKVDQSTTRSYHQFGQPWLVISPGGRVISASDNRRMTIFTAVHEPRVYPGRVAGDPRPLLPGQSFGSLSGHRSSGRRADGRAFAVGDQGAMRQYAIAWPYRCAAGSPCPEAARWRVLQIDIEGTGGQEGLKVRRVARQLVESIRPITNALAPAGASVPEEPTLFADAPVVVGRGGQGDYAWEITIRKGSGQDYWTEIRHQNGDLWYGGLYQAPGRSEQQAMIHCLPSQKRATAMLVEGYGSEAVAKVVLELRGRPPVEVATFRNEKFPFTFWVVAPLPPDARPLSFTSFDAAGQQIAKDTSFSGYERCNP